MAEETQKRSYNLKELISFFHISLPFSVVNGVVWGIAIIVIPLLAGSTTKAGLCFSMINLGIALGAIAWGFLSHIFKVDTLVFASSFLAFVFWGALTLLHGKMIVPISFGFGLSSAGIFALASVVVTKRYEKEKWESYIALMQAFMTGGTVVGLLITSVYASPIIAVPLLAVAFISYIPLMHPSLSTIKTHKQIRLSKSPLSYLVRLFGRYSHRHIRLSRMKIKTRINKAIAILDFRWTVALLAVAPVYAIYPLLMKDLFGIDHRICSLIYAISTAIGVYLFIVAGKLAKQKNSLYPFNISTLLYFLTFVLMGAGYLLKMPLLGAVGFMLMIFGWSFISVGMNISVVELVSPEKRAEALGVANSLQSLDNMAGGMIAGALSVKFGNPSIILFGLVLAFIALATALLDGKK